MNKLINSVKDFLFFKPPLEERDFYLTTQESAADYDVRTENTETTSVDTVSESLDENLAYVKKRFTYPLNNDIVIREIKMREDRRAFIVFIDGMVNSDAVDFHAFRKTQRPTGSKQPAPSARHSLRIAYRQSAGENALQSRRSEERRVG